MNIPLENLEILQRSINDLKQENQKLKNVIEILKPHLSLEFNAEENVYILRINISPFPVGIQITKEQYEIIREVLEND